ncbi:MAG: hypothetical protein BWY09_00307 [Candidatus Hydrogenedentes bacterium ADurb.Bin179]|nr:MAG: hypothetical protein BWY09_00307 [Candidatus Hydrogenedentes bacterium ADurb.Bin179]
MVAGIAVFPQDQALGAHLYPFRFISALGNVRRCAPLHIHRHRHAPLLLHQVNLRDQAQCRRRQQHRPRLGHHRILDQRRPVRFPAGLPLRFRQRAAFLIHPPMLKGALHRVRAVGEFPLHPLHPAQPWTIGILVQHPRRHQVRQHRYQCLFFRVNSHLVSFLFFPYGHGYFTAHGFHISHLCLYTFRVSTQNVFFLSLSTCSDLGA